MKGTIVDLKKKASTIKTKITEHSDEVAKIAYYSLGVVVGAVVVSRMNKKTIDAHQDCHNFTRWICDVIDRTPGEKFTIWTDDDQKRVFLEPPVKNIES